jgi:uncharacterized protein YaeQ
MALKATIYKVSLEISDLDRQLYSDHELTIARHPSETDERMMVRVLAFALNVPPDEDHGALEFGKDMWDAEEPSLLRKDLTGQLQHWLEIGQPDEKRLLRASSRSGAVTVYSFSSSTPIWWSGMAGKLDRARNLTVWQLPAEQSQALAALAQRTMKLQVTVQDGSVWVGDGQRSVEATPRRLYGSADGGHPRK